MQGNQNLSLHLCCIFDLEALSHFLEKNILLEDLKNFLLLFQVKLFDEAHVFASIEHPEHERTHIMSLILLLKDVT